MAFCSDQVFPTANERSPSHPSSTSNISTSQHLKTPLQGLYETFETIATAIIAILSAAQNVHYTWQVLRLALDGAIVGHI